MTICEPKHRKPLFLGKQGENLAKTFNFDVSGWAAEFGDGTAVLLHQRSGDDAPYICTTTQEDGVVTWTVTNADNAIAGSGKAELQYIVGNVVVKSHTWDTVVAEALEEAGETPDSESGWVAQLLAKIKALGEEMFEAANSQLQQLLQSAADSLTAFESDIESNFNEWFESIKGILGEDEAGALQLEIEALQEQNATLTDMMLVGAISAWLTDEDGNVLTIDGDADNGVIATVKICKC